MKSDLSICCPRPKRESSFVDSHSTSGKIICPQFSTQHADITLKPFFFFGMKRYYFVFIKDIIGD